MGLLFGPIFLSLWRKGATQTGSTCQFHIDGHPGNERVIEMMTPKIPPIVIIKLLGWKSSPHSMQELWQHSALQDAIAVC